MEGDGVNKVCIFLSYLVLPVGVLVAHCDGREGQGLVEVDVDVDGNRVAVEVNDPLYNLEGHERGA